MTQSEWSMMLEDDMWEAAVTEYPTFERWLREVDGCLESACGLTSDDLADKPYRDWWENDVTPSTAADWVLQEEQWEAEGHEFAPVED